MVTTIRERAEALREAARDDTRVKLTDLTRTNTWKTQLKENGVLQLTDRSETTAFIVSKESMDELLDTIADYEAIAETMSVRDIFEARKNHTNIQSGKQLADNALKAFELHKDEFMARARKELGK